MRKGGGWKMEIYPFNKVAQPNCVWNGLLNGVHSKVGLHKPLPSGVINDGTWHQITCQRTAEGEALIVDGQTLRVWHPSQHRGDPGRERLSRDESVWPRTPTNQRPGSRDRSSQRYGRGVPRQSLGAVSSGLVEPVKTSGASSGTRAGAGRRARNDESPREQSSANCGLLPAVGVALPGIRAILSAGGGVVPESNEIRRLRQQVIRDLADLPPHRWRPAKLNRRQRAGQMIRAWRGWPRQVARPR
jgi:hypothetical protein